MKDKFEHNIEMLAELVYAEKEFFETFAEIQKKYKFDIANCNQEKLQEEMKLYAQVFDVKINV